MYLNHGKRAKQPNKDNNRKCDIYKAGQVTRWCFKLGRFNESIISLACCENNKFYASHSGNYNYGKTSMTMAITTPTTPIPCTTITTA